MTDRIEARLVYDTKTQPLSAGVRTAGQRARRYVPADQIATQDVRATLAGRAVRAAPACQSTIVRKKGEIAGILRGIAGAVMARVVAMDPVLTGTGRGR